MKMFHLEQDNNKKNTHVKLSPKQNTTRVGRKKVRERERIKQYLPEQKKLRLCECNSKCHLQYGGAFSSSLSLFFSVCLHKSCSIVLYSQYLCVFIVRIGTALAKKHKDSLKRTYSLVNRSAFTHTHNSFVVVVFCLNFSLSLSLSLPLSWHY